MGAALTAAQHHNAAKVVSVESDIFAILFQLHSDELSPLFSTKTAHIKPPLILFFRFLLLISLAGCLMTNQGTVAKSKYGLVLAHVHSYNHQASDGTYVVFLAGNICRQRV